MNTEVVYLDTTILVASFVHAPKIKSSILQTVKKYRFAITGQLVVQEFTRRLLREADYLLRQLKKRGTVAAVQRHLLSLSHHHNRKFRICLQAITTVDEDSSEEDNAERLKYFLEELLEGGLEEVILRFNATVLECTGCACAKQGVKKLKNAYSFPDKQCSSYDECGIVNFLKSDKSLDPLKDFLASRQAQLTNELKDGLEFLNMVSKDKTCAPRYDPCLSVGDTLISLESRSAGVFFTQNFKDSKLLCEQSGQILVVCQTNADKV